MVTKLGTLHGVGVGPGDPELLTVKAARLISNASVVAYLAANGKDSTARDIAKSYIQALTSQGVHGVCCIASERK